MSDLLPDHVGVLVGITQPDHDRPLSAWLKDPRSVTGDGATINPRTAHRRLGVEAEVALLIGAPTSAVAPADLPSCVLGWTIANDITDLEQATTDPRTFTAKNGRGYTPIGPRIELGLPRPTDRVTLSVDGVRKHTATVDSLPVTPLETLQFVARWIDLEAGDVILTGALTPSLHALPGQEVAIHIGALGPLTTRFATQTDPH